MPRVGNVISCSRPLFHALNNAHYVQMQAEQLLDSDNIGLEWPISH